MSLKIGLVVIGGCFLAAVVYLRSLAGEPQAVWLFRGLFGIAP